MRWPMLRHVERQASRMNEMMERMDVDPVQLARLRDGDAYAEARTACLHCINAQDCLLWLDAAQPGAGTPDFCPNTELFKACKRT